MQVYIFGVFAKCLSESYLDIIFILFYIISSSLIFVSGNSYNWLVFSFIHFIIFFFFRSVYIRPRVSSHIDLFGDTVSLPAESPKSPLCVLQHFSKVPQRFLEKYRQMCHVDKLKLREEAGQKTGQRATEK